MRSAIFVEMSSKTPGATMSSGRFSRAASLCRLSGFTFAYLQDDQHSAQRCDGEVDRAGAGKGIGRDKEQQATDAESGALQRRELAEEKAADGGGYEPYPGARRGDRGGDVECIAREQQSGRGDEEERQHERRPAEHARRPADAHRTRLRD